MIAVNERQLSRVIRAYVEYFHADRTHLGLGKDTPVPRVLESPEMGRVISFPRVGGLHHRYSRRTLKAA